MILRKQKNAQVLLGDVTQIDLAEPDRRRRSCWATPTSPRTTRLIVAAGAGQSYFGNDHFAECAPGMKTD